jgi:hypothetical protein
MPSARRAGAQCRKEESIAVAAFGFGLIERKIRVGDERIGLRGIMGSDRDARTASQVQDVAIDVEWISEPLQEHIDDFRDHARIAAIGNNNNNDELVVAEPAYLGGLRKTIRDLDEALTDLDEQLIAGRMTQRVVNILEAVQVEQRDRYRDRGGSVRLLSGTLFRESCNGW